MLAHLIVAPGSEAQQMLDALHGCTSAMRIVPGPPVVSLIAYARIWYEWTGQRQWIVAPTLEQSRSASHRRRTV
jgi:hypothetical protein